MVLLLAADVGGGGGGDRKGGENRQTVRQKQSFFQAFPFLNGDLMHEQENREERGENFKEE